MTSIQLKPINQQVVAIVGASSGIGREAALQFAAKGAKVVVAARSEGGLRSLVEEITQKGGEAISILADVADFNQVKAIAEKTVEHFGRLDTWVHAAATSVFASFENLTPEEFKRIVDVNLMGQVYGAMVAIPYLKQTGQGALIHISSVEAHRSLPLQSAYSASKHGIEGFLDSLRVELQHDNVPISVTNVMPSTINTPFYTKTVSKLGVKPTGIPPYYQPDIVAEAILHVSEHPTRDIIVGDSGRAIDLLQKVSPHLADAILGWIAVDGQKTSEPKSEEGNLYHAIEKDNRVRGDYSHKTIPSFFEWLDFYQVPKWGPLVGLGALALLISQALKDSSS